MGSSEGLVGEVKRRGSRRHPGVRWVESERHGRIYYVRYRQGRRLVEERVGTEAEGYTAELAAVIRGNRVQALRHGQELPLRRDDLPTLGEVWKGYGRWAEQHKRSYRHDAARWRLHLEPRFGRRTPDEIRGAELEDLARSLHSTHADSTVRQILMLFGGLWRWGVAEGLIPRRVERPQVRRLPRPHNSRERFLSPEEVEGLLAELRPRSAAAYGLTLLGYHTGARKGELLALTWGDVDLRHGVLVFPDTKGGGPRRVPLSGPARAHFEALLPGVGKPPPQALVFPARAHGGVIGTLPRTWQDAADRLFNPPGTLPRHRVVFHSLRHSFTSRLVGAGVPLRTVQELTGHKTLSMLQRYAHLAPDAGRAAMGVFEKEKPARPRRRRGGR